MKFTNNKKLKAVFYDPYLDTIGGGERYLLSAAVALKNRGWSVDLTWNNPKIIASLEERLGLDLGGIELIDGISKGAGYDLIFWLSDGSVPLLFAKQNIIHFQTPFQNVNGRSVWNKLKFLKIKTVIVNSEFTKTIIDKEFGINSMVLYPPVSTHEFKSSKKENIILSVGRFSQLQQAKRQDILVEVFKKMYRNGFKGWKLVLIGGSDVGGNKYVDNLKNESKGYPIDILENLPFKEIKKYYSKAKIFWSASGFGIDENKEPSCVEHFGITVVEAMSAGVVPLVVNKGGHKEIVKDGENGLLWETRDQLQEKTLELAENERRREKLAKEAEKRSEYFSVEKFEEKFIANIKNQGK